MTDSELTSDWMTAYQQRRQREKEEAREAVAKTCDSLTELGVTHVRIAYDGYGDSGAVESVTATVEEEPYELPGDLRDELTSVAERLLPDGWENNEGAFGEFVLAVSQRRLVREHNWRVETTEYDEEAWEL